MITDDEMLQELVDLNIGKYFEEILRSVGIEMNELPDELSELLDECVFIQLETCLHTLNIENLKTYFYELRKTKLENKIGAAEIESQITQYARQLEEDTGECEMLEKFIKSVSETKKDENQISLDSKIEMLKTRQNSLQLPENINLDKILENVLVLKNKQQT